jgi:hypothetical protein
MRRETDNGGLSETSGVDGMFIWARGTVGDAESKTEDM